MKTLLLIFSDWLNKQFRLIDPKLYNENDFIIEFMVCDKKDITDIIEHLEDRERAIGSCFRYLNFYNISINDVFKFKQDSFKLYKCYEENFDLNHGFIYIEFNNCKINDINRISCDFIRNEYKSYMKDYHLESINDLKLDYEFKESDSKIDKLRTELLEVIESKFKEIESRINKYF